MSAPPVHAQLFIDVLGQAAADGLVDPSVDLATVAAIFPAFALHRVVVTGRPVDHEFASGSLTRSCCRC